ncbi:MAG: DNA photolyase family protein [Bacteroidetes bacterium]|nr:DNA photolyase family protein [Bacteroidota bacterium]
MKKSISVFWFRRDLRLEDNAGLFHCLNEGNEVLPVFIFDKGILDGLDQKQDRRVDFIYQAILKLQEKLLYHGSSLMVLYDTPINAFKQITEKFEVKSVFTNRDYEPYALERDTKINNYLKVKGIVFNTFKDQVIFEKQEVLKSNGEPYTVFTPYSKIWKEKLNETYLTVFSSEKFADRFLKTPPISIPSLEKMGFKRSDLKFKALKIDLEIIKNYDSTRNIPSINGTTKLSVHLRFGTVSVRQLAKIALKLNEQWLNELIWREFFMCILFHFPMVTIHSFKKKYDNIKWRNNENEFEKWCQGQTGYPIVDAGMRELNETGFMHNRVRMIVASFLTKHLLIDWRWGEAYFAEKLLDYELSSNNGNWQWAAGCGCDAAPYFRIFNPAEQTKRFDPEHKYINKWVKEFTSPDYIAPIVEHRLARERALEVYKEGVQ